MSCAPCCKHSPDRQCAKCFSDQEWVTPFPGPVEYWNDDTDLIKDGAGDASVGTCGPTTGDRDGSNGYDSHTRLATRKGSDSDKSLVGTEQGDSLARPEPWQNRTISNQFFGNQLYPVAPINRSYSNTGGSALIDGGEGIGFLRLRGNFHMPAKPILDATYTKGLQIKIGADREGGNVNGEDLWNSLTRDPVPPARPTDTVFFNPTLRGPFGAGGPLVTLMQWSLTFAGTTYLIFVGNQLSFPAEYEVVNGDNITRDDYDNRSLNQRRIFLLDNGLRYDTGLVLSDFMDNGLTVRTSTIQTSVQLSAISNKYAVGLDIEHSIPQSGLSVKRSATTGYTRCQIGLASVDLSQARKHNVQGIPNGYNGALNFNDTSDSVRVTTGNPAWWLTELESLANKVNNMPLFMFSWMSDFRVTDGDFSDTAAFVVRHFLHYDSSGNLKNSKHAGDFDDVTIPDGTTIEVGVLETGDYFELGLDNLGEQTTQVSFIGFDDPFITGVDEQNPNFIPYEFKTITFTTAPLLSDGTSDITINHGQGGNVIPDPYTLTISGLA